MRKTRSFSAHAQRRKVLLAMLAAYTDAQRIAETHTATSPTKIMGVPVTADQAWRWACQIFAASMQYKANLAREQLGLPIVEDAGHGRG
jgi:hypothetical protein